MSNMAAWKMCCKWRFNIAGKTFELNGGFSREPCLITGGYPGTHFNLGVICEAGSPKKGLH